MCLWIFHIFAQLSFYCEFKCFCRISSTFLGNVKCWFTGLLEEKLSCWCLNISLSLCVWNDRVTLLSTVVEPECEKSSATTYYWYREALNISNSISESGGLNWKMTICLLAAWVVVCLAMIKGIQSSGKVSMLELWFC